MNELSELTAPDAGMIERLARTAIAALPQEFAGPAQEVAIRVEDFAGEDFLQELDIDDPYELTGLYEGIPMTEKSVSDPAPMPDTIWLFRRAILDEWISRGEVTLGELIGHVVIHELAHHFGWSDEDIARIDRWWE